MYELLRSFLTNPLSRKITRNITQTFFIANNFVRSQVAAYFVACYFGSIFFRRLVAPGRKRFSHSQNDFVKIVKFYPCSAHNSMLKWTLLSGACCKMGERFLRERIRERNFKHGWNWEKIKFFESRVRELY